jgi:hypothetical protein
MPVGAAEIKLGFDIFSKLIGWATGKRKNKEIEKLISQAFQELLKGDSSDLVKVAAAIKKLRKEGDCSVDKERLEKLYKTFRSGEHVVQYRAYKTIKKSATNKKAFASVCKKRFKKVKK